MQVVNVTTARRYAPQRMVKYGLFETEHLFCDIYCLEPGQEQAVHAHADSDKIYVLLEGRAMVTIGPEQRELQPMEAVLAPAGQTHGIANHSDQRAAALVFFAPKPRHE
jgi:mannose-6-phosphate isomerase-like protein (cupin superfamily)